MEAAITWINTLLNDLNVTPVMKRNLALSGLVLLAIFLISCFASVVLGLMRSGRYYEAFTSYYKEKDDVLYVVTQMRDKTYKKYNAEYRKIGKGLKAYKKTGSLIDLLNPVDGYLCSRKITKLHKACISEQLGGNIS